MILVDSFGSTTPLKLPRVSLNVQIIHKYSYNFLRALHNMIGIFEGHGTDPRG